MCRQLAFDSRVSDAVDGCTYYAPHTVWGGQASLRINDIEVEDATYESIFDANGLFAHASQRGIHSSAQEYLQATHVHHAAFRALHRAFVAEGKMLLWCTRLLFTITVLSGYGTLHWRILRAECITTGRDRVVRDLLV